MDAAAGAAAAGLRRRRRRQSIRHLLMPSAQRQMEHVPMFRGPSSS
jgi:hypothetical protein